MVSFWSRDTPITSGLPAEIADVCRTNAAVSDVFAPFTYVRGNRKAFAAIRVPIEQEE